MYTDGFTPYLRALLRHKPDYLSADTLFHEPLPDPYGQVGYRPYTGPGTMEGLPPVQPAVSIYDEPAEYENVALAYQPSPPEEEIALRFTPPFSSPGERTAAPQRSSEPPAYEPLSPADWDRLMQAVLQQMRCDYEPMPLGPYQYPEEPDVDEALPPVPGAAGGNLETRVQQAESEGYGPLEQMVTMARDEIGPAPPGFAPPAQPDPFLQQQQMFDQQRAALDPLRMDF